MQSTITFPPVQPGAPQPGSVLLQGAACPLCRTARRALTDDAPESQASWRCDRCGQRWDADSLATVVGYAAWALKH